MKVTVIAASELTQEQLQHWAALQEANPALHSPYFAPQFTQAVAAVRDDVFVGMVEEVGRVVVFFPFQKGRLKTGRPVGGALSDFHGVITDAQAQFDAVELIRRCGLSTWDFNHLIASQKPFVAHHQTVVDSQYMDLSAGYEAYATARRANGSEQIKKTGNLSRKLERECGPIKFKMHCTDAAVLQQLLAWKSSQYLESKLVDIFKLDWTRRLLTHLMQTQQDGFAGALSVLSINDRVIAAHFGIRSARVLHYWFPAYDPEFAKFSPGLILLLRMAMEGAAMGLQRIDMGKGDAQYKERLASGTVGVAEGCVEVPSWTVAMRRLRKNAENWARGSPLGAVAKIPGRLILRAERKQRFH